MKRVMPNRACGTLAGCHLHDRHGEEQCLSCQEAWQAIQAQRCGTPDGYRMHLDMGETPCERCRSAMREHLRTEQAVTP